MKRVLKFRYDAALGDWYAKYRGACYSVRFERGCGWESFILHPCEDCWEKIHTTFEKSFRDARNLCEKHVKFGEGE